MRQSSLRLALEQWIHTLDNTRGQTDHPKRASFLE